MAKDTFLNRKHLLNCKGKPLDLSKPSVMAILNLTPDSFFAQSRANTISKALKKTETFLQEGAKIIDIGAYSSKPHAIDITVEKELERLTPVIEAISLRFPECLLSVDTFRAKVAKEAIEAGVHIVNDISAGNLDDGMFKTIARLKAAYIAMHMRGNPQTMQQFTDYSNVTKQVAQYFEDKIFTLKEIGITDVIIDLGFGFAKTIDQNYQLLKNLTDFHRFRLPLLAGFSRKSMITKLLNIETAAALNGTTVLNTVALLKGVKILRVHDVKQAVECINLINCLID